MENNNDYTIDKINHLINIAEDGKEGYENAAEDVKDSEFKSAFLIFAQERSNYATQLRQIVHQLGGDSEGTGGGSAGSLHRVWMDLKSVFTSGDSEAIINACTTGEEAAIKEYKMILADDQISESFKPLIGDQLNGIEQALASIKLHVHSSGFISEMHAVFWFQKLKFQSLI